MGYLYIQWFLRVADVLRLLSYRHVGIGTLHSKCWVNQSMQKVEWSKGRQHRTYTGLGTPRAGKENVPSGSGHWWWCWIPGTEKFAGVTGREDRCLFEPSKLSLLLIWGLWGKANHFQVQNWCNAPVSTAESFIPEPWWRWGSECRCHGGTDGRPLSLFTSPNNPPQRESSATLLETCDAVSVSGFISWDWGAWSTAVLSNRTV